MRQSQFINNHYCAPQLLILLTLSLCFILSLCFSLFIFPVSPTICFLRRVSICNVFLYLKPVYVFKSHFCI